MVVGEDGTKGGLWCSPVAKTSSPTSSAFTAIATIALIRSASVGVRPFVGSGVTSPTEKMPSCMSRLQLLQLQVVRRRQRIHARGYARGLGAALRGTGRGNG